MVKVREDQLINTDGTIDLNAWLKQIEAAVPLESVTELRAACELSMPGFSVQNDTKILQDNFRVGIEMAEILAELQLDQTSIMAAVLYHSVHEDRLSLQSVKERFGDSVAKLIQGVDQMAAISAYQQGKITLSDINAKAHMHAENLRKMLVAMIDDVRVAVIKLAERTCRIRLAKNDSEQDRTLLAQEIADIYAPLAHRLGIGHIKWELEDLSFRYLQPEAYKKIAQLLDERRIDRQRFISDVVQALQKALLSVDIVCEVQGRAKHIYSIWRKMQRKKIEFSQIYDVRAVRIMVDQIRDCYAALGIVHSLWRHIPNEFDDYIASPKSNGYQSLHTAVLGPDGKILEVQIRTRAMHEDAELGVCAHWMYKGTDIQAKDRGYEQKMAWLRQVLEWHEELGDVNSVVKQWQTEVAQDRIYLFTPKGEIIDLHPGATPVDFAYRLHTEVGHRCRGAKINGRIVPLTYRLKTGEQVEILTAKEARPSRDWLNQDSGYVTSTRARAKIAHWFKMQAREQHVLEGRQLLLTELQRLALEEVNLNDLAKQFNVRTSEDIFAALGAGDFRIGQIISVAQRQMEPEIDRSPLLDLPEKIEKTVSGSDAVYIRGVGNLLSQMAHCCQPVPGDGIVGYITVGRGVSIHRQDCGNLLQLKSESPGRIIEVSWGQEKSKTTYPVEVCIKAYDRKGLLKDITLVLATDSVNVVALSTLTNHEDQIADIVITLEIEDLAVLSRALNKINQLPNVLEARRHRAPKGSESY